MHRTDGEVWTSTKLLRRLAWHERGELDAEIVAVVSSVEGVKGIDIARDAGIPVRTITRKDVIGAENYAAALEEVLRLKPASSKGRYIKKVTFSTTMGPGIQVDPNRVKNVASEDETAPA